MAAGFCLRYSLCFSGIIASLDAVAIHSTFQFHVCRVFGRIHLVGDARTGILGSDGVIDVRE